MTPRFVRLLIATVLAVSLLPSWVCAQSVDIDQELQEERLEKVPFLRSHPWQRIRQAWIEEMDQVEQEVGFRAGVSLTSIFQHAAGIDAPNNTFVQSLDLLGQWKLLDLPVLGEGTVGVLYRTRVNGLETNGNQLSAAIGMPWGINNSGSDSYNRFNQLWWEEKLSRQTLVVKLGRVDQSALFDQNRVASSDGKQFLMQSLVHSQTIAFPSNGTGFNLRYEPGAGYYLAAGFGDANGSPDKRPREGLRSFANGQYFEAAEVGFSPNLSSIWPAARQGTYRFMGWHTATTSGHRAGYGFDLSLDQEVGNGVVSFLRFGVCPDDVFKTSIELSVGVVALNPFGRSTDRAGVGVTWGKPVAPANRDQFAGEVFYQLEMVEGLAIAPDLELIAAPAFEPKRDLVAVLGLRLRLSL